MNLDPSPLINQAITSVEKKDHTWFFTLSGGDILATEEPWRLVTAEGTGVTSEDHEQRFGLTSPMDAASLVVESLAEDEICNATHDIRTGDLFLHFPADRYLQFLQLSCGYESWRLHMHDREYICMGGGITSFDRSHFPQDTATSAE